MIIEHPIPYSKKLYLWVHGRGFIYFVPLAKNMNAQQSYLTYLFLSLSQSRPFSSAFILRIILHVFINSQLYVVYYVITIQTVEHWWYSIHAINRVCIVCGVPVCNAAWNLAYQFIWPLADSVAVRMFCAAADQLWMYLCVFDSFHSTINMSDTSL